MGVLQVKLQTDSNVSLNLIQEATQESPSGCADSRMVQERLELPARTHLERGKQCAGFLTKQNTDVIRSM